MQSEEFKLDSPVWYSLGEMHHQFAIDYGDVRFYHPEYCPFGGAVSIDVAAGIGAYSKLIQNFFVLGDRPLASSLLKMTREVLCLQMVLDKRIEIEVNEKIEKLEIRHHDELFRLVNLVQPGYFKIKTPRMGDYYGIFKKGALVAVTGERMKMNLYTEVSAVVTHPDHVGQGYAKQLVAYVSNKIFDENKIPYLHVTETNTGAIQLYEKLGFATRRKISLWNFIPA